MNLNDLCVYLILASVLANVADYVLNGRRDFCYLPRTGARRHVLWGWMAAMVVCALLVQLGFVPFLWLAVVGAGWVVYFHMCAIIARHAHSH